jgi:Zn-finger domain-containing protein
MTIAHKYALQNLKAELETLSRKEQIALAEHNKKALLYCMPMNQDQRDFSDELYKILKEYGKTKRQ